MPLHEPGDRRSAASRRDDLASSPTSSPSATRSRACTRTRRPSSTSTEETTLDDNVDTRPSRDHRPDRRPDHRQDSGDVAARRRRDVHLPDRRPGRPHRHRPCRWSGSARTPRTSVVTDTLPPGLVPTAGDVVAGRLHGQRSGRQLRAGHRRRSQVSLDPVAAGARDDHRHRRAGRHWRRRSRTPPWRPRRHHSAAASTASRRRRPHRSTRSADLAVTKVADAPRLPPAAASRSRVTVTNTGPSDATGVVVTDLLPAPLVFSTDGSDDDCGLAGGDVVCDSRHRRRRVPRALTIGATLPPDAAPGVGHQHGVGDLRRRRPRRHATTRRPSRSTSSRPPTWPSRRRRPPRACCSAAPSPTRSPSSTKDRPTPPAWCSPSRSRPAPSSTTLPPGCTGTGPSSRARSATSPPVAP